ncbi:MAG: hypothetical protein V3S14_03500, partial [Anaerolineae bacterium]
MKTIKGTLNTWGTALLLVSLLILPGWPVKANTPNHAGFARSEIALGELSNPRFWPGFGNRSTEAHERPGRAKFNSSRNARGGLPNLALLLWMRSRVESGRTGKAIIMSLDWEELDSPLDAKFYRLLGRAYASEGAERPARES